MSSAWTMADRFWARVTKTETCWLWTTHLDRDGYGIWGYAKNANLRAHRWAYEHFVGPIPPGLTLDHLCKVRNCVNPAHLEPVTVGENAHRGRTATCSRGHAWTSENTGIWITPKGYEHRRCRACDAMRHRRAA